MAFCRSRELSGKSYPVILRWINQTGSGGGLHIQRTGVLLHFWYLLSDSLQNPPPPGNWAQLDQAPTGQMRGSDVPAKAMFAGFSLTKMLSGQDVHAFSNTQSIRNYRISSHLAPMTANKVPASTFPLTTEVISIKCLQGTFHDIYCLSNQPLVYWLISWLRRVESRLFWTIGMPASVCF